MFRLDEFSAENINDREKIEKENHETLPILSEDYILQQLESILVQEPEKHVV
jgi:hypothetical protein